MSTVVVQPQENPWEKTLQNIRGMIQDKHKSSDFEKLAAMNSNNPEEIAKIMPQLKTTEAKETALKMIMGQRQVSQEVPVYGYDKEGKYGQIGKQPANAVTVKPDPDAAIDRRAQWQAQNQQAHDERQAQRTEQHDSAMMERMLQVAGLKSDQKTPNEIELAQRAAKGDKEAASTLQTLSDYRAQAAGAKAGATAGVKSKTADPKSVQFYGDQILAGNPMPMGMASGMREAVGSYVQDKMDKLGDSPQDVATRTNVRKGLASSLSNQEKQIGMMGGFVKNLDKQVDRVSEIEQDMISRVGVRALDMPIREIKTRFAGSGNEKVLEAYTTEISNEIGKLSTGSSASVRELSVEAQDRWAKIHDPNLSFKELKTILEETKHMGQMRLESSQQERDYTTDRLKSIGGSAQKPAESFLDRFWK